VRRVPPRRAAAAGELLRTLAAFVLGLLLATLPGVPAAVSALMRALFGPLTVTGDAARQVQAIPLTPLASLLAAGALTLLARVVDPGDPALPRRPRLASAGQALLHLVAAILGSAALAAALQALGAPVAEQALVLEVVAGPARRPEVGILAISALLLAPLGEELLFRGHLFRRVLLRAGPLPAYLASALLFAAFHGNLHGLVIYTWLGLVFAHAYAVTGRLGVAVAVHFGNNALTLAALLTQGA
jgi:membrane protease YdiL (CAAX protease family)